MLNSHYVGTCTAYGPYALACVVRAISSVHGELCSNMQVYMLKSRVCSNWLNSRTQRSRHANGCSYHVPAHSLQGWLQWINSQLMSVWDSYRPGQQVGGFSALFTWHRGPREPSVACNLGMACITIHACDAVLRTHLYTGKICSGVASCSCNYSFSSIHHSSGPSTLTPAKLKQAASVGCLLLRCGRGQATAACRTTQCSVCTGSGKLRCPFDRCNCCVWLHCCIAWDQHLLNAMHDTLQQGKGNQMRC